MGRSFISLDVVDKALEAGRPERREGDEDRREPKPKEPEGPKVMLWALALVGAAAVALGAAQFTDLKTEFRTHKVIEEQKHEELRRSVEAIHTQLELRAQADTASTKLLRAMARKLRVTVTEAEGDQ